MATLTVYSGTSCTINGKVFGRSGAQSFTITGVTKAVEGNFTAADGTAGTILTITATEGGNTLTSLKALEVKNTESSGNPLIIGLVSGSKAAYVEVPAGQTRLLLTDQIDANATGGAFSALSAITSVTAEGRGATAALEFTAYGT